MTAGGGGEGEGVHLDHEHADTYEHEDLRKVELVEAEEREEVLRLDVHQAGLHERRDHQRRRELDELGVSRNHRQPLHAAAHLVMRDGPGAGTADGRTPAVHRHTDTVHVVGLWTGWLLQSAVGVHEDACAIEIQCSGRLRRQRPRMHG